MSARAAHRTHAPRRAPRRGGKARGRKQEETQSDRLERLSHAAIEDARSSGDSFRAAKPVADVGLVVFGEGVGANGDLLLEPVRRHLAEWVPLSAGA